MSDSEENFYKGQELPKSERELDDTEQTTHNTNISNVKIDSQGSNSNEKISKSAVRYSLKRGRIPHKQDKAKSQLTHVPSMSANPDDITKDAIEARIANGGMKSPVVTKSTEIVDDETVSAKETTTSKGWNNSKVRKEKSRNNDAAKPQENKHGRFNSSSNKKMSFDSSAKKFRIEKSKQKLHQSAWARILGFFKKFIDRLKTSKSQTSLDRSLKHNFARKSKANFEKRHKKTSFTKAK